MSKNFDDEQLTLIRDVFGDMCYNHIEQGNRFDAQEELDIINTVQEQLEEDGFKDLAHFILNDSNTWGDTEERDLTDEEEAAVRAMVEWASTSEGDDKPTPKLRKAVDEYLNEYVIFTLSPEERTKKRLEAINMLIAVCERECPDMLKKLDKIKKELAENPSVLSFQFHSYALQSYHNLVDKKRNIIVAEEKDSMGILMAVGSTLAGFCKVHGDMTAVKALLRERMINDDAFFSIIKSSVAYVTDYRKEHHVTNNIKEDE